MKVSNDIILTNENRDTIISSLTYTLKDPDLSDTVRLKLLDVISKLIDKSRMDRPKGN